MKTYSAEQLFDILNKADEIVLVKTKHNLPGGMEYVTEGFEEDLDTLRDMYPEKYFKIIGW